MDRLHAVSLFSGCGGFDWGAQEAGIDIIWANDIYAPAAAAYQSLFPSVHFETSDIRKVLKFPEADVLIGCYPCTGFSLAARRRWRNQESRELQDNEDNFLYREYMRALRQIKPRFLFVENVGGMVSAEDGWFFERQLEGFRRHGYAVKHAVLKAEEFGVPQTRRRMFIVGIRKDQKGINYEFPPATYGQTADRPYRVLKDAIKDLEGHADNKYYAGTFHGHYLTRNRKRAWDQMSYTIVANFHHVPLHPSGEPMVYVTKDKWVLQGDMNRRLSWVECGRIQGLPDNILPTGTLEHKYRVVGNAVPPALGRAIVSPIVNALRREKRRHSSTPD